MVESETGETAFLQEVAALERGDLKPDTPGLKLSEARSILAGIETIMVEQQVTRFLDSHGVCAQCNRQRSRKGRRRIVYRTPFGKLRLNSPRLYRCPCHKTGPKSFSPLAELLYERTSPELVYLETKFAALVSYGVSVEMLKEVLPISQDVSPAAIRQRVQQVAERLDRELGEEQAVFINGCQQDWENLPDPAPPLIVGIDGGYVHGCEQKSRQEGWFEVIVGKSIPEEDAPSKSFGFVSQYDAKSKRRLFEMLNSQGMQMNQEVTFLSDGGDTVRSLQLHMNPQAEHILDWFHVTMRLTVMSLMAKSVTMEDRPNLSTEMETQIERVKWNLWNGNVRKTLKILEGLETTLDVHAPSLEVRKLLKAVREFFTYISTNKEFIVNYGDRYRHGERISTGFVESAVNQIISKRFVKKQQMRWSKRGAHSLLQVRTKVLDGDWRSKLSQWYPGIAEAA